MPSVPHDLFIWDAVPIGCRNESRPHSVQADWFEPAPFEAGLGGSLQ